jgi:glycosyltransferase involved in cell wall biosynthesis
VRPANRILVWLNHGFYRFGIAAALAASLRSATQVQQLRNGRPLRIEVFLPTYTEDLFASVPSALDMPPEAPFGVFFAGRIVENKGIFDLVEIARALDASHPGRFHFHVCGDGADLPAMREEIDRRRLGSTVTTHGFCAGDEIADIIRRCHATIVPTRSSCEEGFNMVCAESVLFRRPVVTSAVCPALDFIPNASLEVPPDDVAAYRDALVTLLDDSMTYRRLVRGCEIDRAQFLDAEQSYEARYQQVLTDMIESTPG